APADKPKPAIGEFGFDVAGMDTTIKPGDDFFRYSGGLWMKKEQMPSDRSRWGTFDKLRAKAEEDVRVLIEELAAKKNAPGSIEQKIADFYNSYMDTAAIEKRGLAPAKAALDEIANAKTHEALVQLTSRPDVPTTGPIAFSFSLDEKNPD